VHKYEAIFKLLDAGLLLEAMNLSSYLSSFSSKKAKKGKGKKEATESMVDTEAKEGKEEEEEAEEEDSGLDAEEFRARIGTKFSYFIYLLNTSGLSVLSVMLD